jgi:pSer/pThr/pTyr-binding forkhead associated (FHA) protein
MEATLVVVAGRANKDTVALQLPTVIGRSQDATLSVAHRTISRRHCEVFEVEGLLMIRDLGSLNGTVVDGQRIAEAPLCPDDEFSIGPLTFRAQYEYNGDRSNVPAVKLADDQKRRSNVDAKKQLPDFPTVEGSPRSDSAGAPVEDEAEELTEAEDRESGGRQ